MFQSPRAAGGHDGDCDHISNGPCKFQIVTGQGAVSIHTGGQNDARPQFLALSGPGNGVLSHGFRPP